MEILKNIILSAVVIDCCLVFYCKGVALTLGDIPTNVYVQNEQSLDIECILPSGNLDSTVLRNWDKDGVTVVNGGAPVNSGSGYSETLQSDRFILTTPKLNYSFDGTQYKCTYRFSQASVIVKIADIGTTDQSKGDCIDGKSIEKCWFSLSKVLPVITTQSNLTVSYEDDTVENINSALNTTAQLNADGNTWAYYFRIEQNSILKEVKAITLSFEAGPFTRVLTINSIKDCFLDIFLCGFLPDSLIEVIASITIFIILKKECLPKLFGEFAWKKVGITAVFCVIAIIIGVCLGLLIKGCDKKFLALGLSFLFGILLVVALIIVLIYYHKKCESKSGS